MDPTVPDVLSDPTSGRSTGFDTARLQTCFNVLARVEEQLRFADSKAAFLATLHAFLIGPLAGNAVGIRAVVASWDPSAHLLLGLTAGAYGVMFLVSMAIVAAAVLPRTGPTGRRASKAFFGQIAREFGHEPHRFISELGALTDRDWLAPGDPFRTAGGSPASSSRRYPPRRRSGRNCRRSATRRRPCPRGRSPGCGRSRRGGPAPRAFKEMVSGSRTLRKRISSEISLLMTKSPESLLSTRELGLPTRPGGASAPELV
ncbi:MAG: hypothetical protein LC745_07120 [Planctomycetia bacterium]|nr:hypothetical protein [Planctomycetia bacterium]